MTSGTGTPPVRLTSVAGEPTLYDLRLVLSPVEALTPVFEVENLVERSLILGAFRRRDAAPAARPARR